MHQLKSLTPPSFKEKLLNIARLHDVVNGTVTTGLPESEIELAEQQLGFKLPQPLKDLYLSVGGNKEAITAFHPINLPNELSIMTTAEEDGELPSAGDLVIAYENQHVFAIRVKLSNGEVYLDFMEEDEPYKTMGYNLEDCLVWLMGQQCLNSELAAGEIVIESSQVATKLKELSYYFQPYIKNNEHVPDVYFNPQDQVLIMGQINKDTGDFQGEIVAAESIYANEDAEDDDEDNSTLAKFERQFDILVNGF